MATCPGALLPLVARARLSRPRGRGCRRAPRRRRRHVVPDADHRVEARIVVGDEVEHGVAAHAGNGARKAWPAAAPRAVPMMASVAASSVQHPSWKIDGSGATPGGRGQVRKPTCPRTRTRPSDWGVAPVPVSAAPCGADRPGREGARRGRVVAYSVAPARIAGGPKCASAPRVVCALQCGHETRAGRHR